MKSSTLFMVLTMAAALVVSATGCKHRPVDTTNIPGKTRVGIGGEGEGKNVLADPKINDFPPIVATNLPEPEIKTFNNPEDTGNGHKQPGDGSMYDKIINGPHDELRDFFAQDTIYFDTDSNVIRPEETSKLEHIAAYFHDNKTDVLKIEGYCDERGTEGYNLALGDRRAIAIREYLIKLGVESGRVGTVSLGEANPVDTGHNEAAWKKNRRGVSVLIKPKAQ